MAKKSSTKQKLTAASLCAAALRLTEQKGWDFVTPDTLAQAVKATPEAVSSFAATPRQLAALMIEDVTDQALAACGASTASAHDALFDLIMARFDVLQKNREAILQIARTARRDGALSCALGRASFETAYRLVDAVGLNTLPRPVAAAGVAAAMGWAFNAWRRDESRDMAKTMAALDRVLRWGDKAATLARRKKAA